MSDIKVIDFKGKRTVDTAEEMRDKIKDIIYEYEGESLAVAVGVLEIVKTEILEEGK